MRFKSGMLSPKFPKLAAAIVLMASAGILNTAMAAHGDSDHSGGHSDGGGHSGGHDDDGDHGSGHGGHSGGDKGHGSTSGHGHGHDTARGASRSVENRIFRRGGRPIWAQEGIPEVELGRLNVGRAPPFVLARAQNKALEEFTETMAELYQLSAEDAATLLINNYDELARIHSPVQNLALYKDVMTFDQTLLPNVTPSSTYDLAAIFLGSASDKNIPVSRDSVIAINRILGLVELSPEDAAGLAAKAETVRSAILTGHGEDQHSDPVKF
jgi:hypothetical protein